MYTLIDQQTSNDIQKRVDFFKLKDDLDGDRRSREQNLAIHKPPKKTTKVQPVDEYISVNEQSSF